METIWVLSSRGFFRDRLTGEGGADDYVAASWEGWSVFPGSTPSPKDLAAGNGSEESCSPCFLMSVVLSGEILSRP